jgi:hypothetical protein
VGGDTHTRVGALAWFELGGHRFERPQVMFSQERDGAFADPHLTGNLGTAFLQPFRVVFNYPAAAVAFVERAPSGR